MGRDHERHAVIHLREDAAEMAVPSVAMHEVGVDVHRVEIGAATHRAEHGAQWFGTGESVRVQLKPADGQISFLPFLVAETAHFNGHRFRPLARQIIDVHTGAAVNVRRIFVGEEERLHLDSLIASAMERTQFHRAGRAAHFRTFKSSTGTSTSCRTLSAVLPWSRSATKRWPCVVIAMRSTDSARASLMISVAGSPI